MNPYAIIGAILFAIALAGGGYYEGWEKRGDHEATVALEVERAAAKKLAAETARADKAEGDLAVEKQNIKTVTVEVTKLVPTVTTIYTEKVGDEPQKIPPAVYTVGFMQLWNYALFPTERLRAGAGEHADLSGGAYQVRAKIDSQDILLNATENFGKWADCRAQLRKLIDFEKSRKPATAAPAQ